VGEIGTDILIFGACIVRAGGVTLLLPMLPLAATYTDNKPDAELTIGRLERIKQRADKVWRDYSLR
jgi:hypothetical protein